MFDDTFQAGATFGVALSAVLWGFGLGFLCWLDKRRERKASVHEVDQTETVPGWSRTNWG